MPEPALLLQVLVVGCAALLMASLLSALSYPLLRRLPLAARPEAASRWVLFYALQAPMCAVLATLALMSPAVAALVVPNHCHGPSCLPHAPEISLLSPGGLALVTASFLGMMLFLLGAMTVASRTRQRLRLLGRLAEPQSSFQQVESGLPLAWCAGLWRPRVFVSSALLHALSKEELEVVLAHEHHHARRRDNLRQLLAHWSTVCWPRALRRALLADLSRHTEQACDAEAARQHGAQLLAELLKRLAATGASCPPTRAANFLDNQRGDRLAELAAPRSPSPWAAPAGLLGLAASSAIHLAVLTAAAHLALEWIT